MGLVPANASFVGKGVLEAGKYAVFGGVGDLINRLIHRSWGESFVATIDQAHHVKILWICLF
jgi:hypothetical protein